MGLYKDELLKKYEDFIVTISVPNIEGSISGFLNSETLDVGLSANWGLTALSGSYKDVLKGMGKSIVGAIPIIGAMGREFIGNFKSMNNTINLWESPGDITLNFEINVIYGVNLKSWTEFELTCNKITQSNYKANKELMLPYFYDNSALSNVVKGDWKALDNQMGRISIGGHFLADKLKIDQLTKAYSSRLMEDGKPAYCKLQVQASPYRTLDAEEIAKWWK